MKKKYIIPILLIFTNILFSEESFSFENQEYIYQVYYSDFPNPGFSFKFEGKHFYMDIPEEDDLKQEEGFYIKEKYSSIYTIEQKEGFTYLRTNSKHFLVLYYESIVCILIDCSNNITYCGIAKSSPYIRLSKRNVTRDTWVGIEDSPATTSSYLIELSNDLTKKYNGNNKYMWQILLPWCEGVAGYGIGEWIQKSFFQKGDKLLLLNGYVDPNHPDYYYKNSRIKDVQVITEYGSKICTLSDSPQLQVINLDKRINSYVRLRIESVYKGTKYDDTCLSYFCLLTEAPNSF